MSNFQTDAIQKDDTTDEENCLIDKYNYELIEVYCNI